MLTQDVCPHCKASYIKRVEHPLRCPRCGRKLALSVTNIEDKAKDGKKQDRPK
jgi:uncharacterized Zn finger protein (UPF0148 family)